MAERRIYIIRIYMEEIRTCTYWRSARAAVLSRGGLLLLSLLLRPQNRHVSYGHVIQNMNARPMPTSSKKENDALREHAGQFAGHAGQFAGHYYLGH